MNERAQIIITEFDEVDKEQYCKLYQAAFSEMFRKNRIVENPFTIEHFNWKYNMPWGKAKLAVVQFNNKIVGAVSMLPCHVIYNGKIYKAWHTGDVAVLPEFEGRFFFNRCMKALRNQVDEDAFIFGFPNHNNLSGAKRAGFPRLKDLHFYFKPVFFQVLGAHAQLMGSKKFDSLQDKYAEILAAKGEAMLYRTADYMNWRYTQRPAVNYFIYNHMSGEEIKGNVVARVVTIRGFRILMVMEFSYVEKSAISYLNRFLKQTARKNKCIVALLISSSERNVSNSIPFIKLPEKLQPRKITFVGNVANNGTHPLIAAEWFIQTGDWDAF